MLSLPYRLRIYISSLPVDMRQGHDGLIAIVKNQWKLDPFEGSLFAFLGKRGDRLKVLFWQRGGFVLYYKRLERGRFKLPKANSSAQHIQIDATALTMLLDGIDLNRVPSPRLWEPPQRLPDSDPKLRSPP